MAETARPNMYIILGHGTEQFVPFNTRERIPDGYTLVTLAQCGVVTTEKQVCPMVEAFATPAKEELLANPEKNKGAIRDMIGGTKINVYKSGMLYPKLSVQLYLDFASLKGPVGKRIMKSGTYKFPLNADAFQIGVGPTFCDKIFEEIPPYEGGPFPKAAGEIFTKMFQESFVPTPAEVEAVVQKNGRRVDKIKKELTVPIENIFKNGPGIYYFVVCRSLKDTISPSNYVQKLRDFEVEEDIIERYDPYMRGDWIPRIPEILPLIEEDSKNPRVQGDKWFNPLDYKREISLLQNIPRTRAMSLNQQGYNKWSNCTNANCANPKGGRRIRRKTRKQSRKRKSRPSRRSRV